MFYRHLLCMLLALVQLDVAIAQSIQEKAGSAAPAASATTGAETAASASDACASSDPGSVVSAIARIAPTVGAVRIVSRQQFLPSSGLVDLLVFRKPDDEKIIYRAIVVDQRTAHTPTPLSTPRLYQVIETAQIWAEPATLGETGTDFKKTETTDPKTLLRFISNTTDSSTWKNWQRAQVYVVGCTVGDPRKPKFVGSFGTVLASTMYCRLLSILLCIFFYLFAATWTFHSHKSQRIVKTNATDQEQPMTGTNYATWLEHLNPVVLSAGGDGRGSATKLQILFFSILVFGLVSYIWMLTGHLTGLSNNVLLLMGISGIGATASAGTELYKNRLRFTNWAWLVGRGWLPNGGVAEANFAEWKDIFTTDGEFDVYRFQMITFSFLVGIALLGAGTQLTDLSSFEIPQALLGILGLSQAVYVVGKLVAPPAISDLDKQIEDLQAIEKKLRDARDKVTSLADVHVLWTEDDTVKAAKVAYSDYLEAWKKTQIMFESTLGRLVPKVAENFRPPFQVPQVIGEEVGVLRPGKKGVSYQVDLDVYGGKSPYKWSVVEGALPLGLLLSHGGSLSGTPTAVGTTSFTLSIVDSMPERRTKKFTMCIEA